MAMKKWDIKTYVPTDFDGDEETPKKGTAENKSKKGFPSSQEEYRDRMAKAGITPEFIAKNLKKLAKLKMADGRPDASSLKFATEMSARELGYTAKTKRGPKSNSKDSPKAYPFAKSGSVLRDRDKEIGDPADKDEDRDVGTV